MNFARQAQVVKAARRGFEGRAAAYRKEEGGTYATQENWWPAPQGCHRRGHYGRPAGRRCRRGHGGDVEQWPVVQFGRQFVVDVEQPISNFDGEPAPGAWRGGRVHEAGPPQLSQHGQVRRIRVRRIRVQRIRVQRIRVQRDEHQRLPELTGGESA
jgi:hypothetical protein